MPETRFFLWANNATAISSVTVNNSTTVIPVVDGSVFPLPHTGEIVTLVLRDDALGKYEVMNMISRSGNLLTVERGAEGSTAHMWESGHTIRHSLTAAWFQARGFSAPTYTYLTSRVYPYELRDGVESSFTNFPTPKFTDALPEGADTSFSVVSGILQLFGVVDYLNARPEGADTVFSVTSGTIVDFGTVAYLNARPEGADTVFSVTSGTMTTFTYLPYVNARPEGADTVFSVTSGVLT